MRRLYLSTGLCAIAVAAIFAASASAAAVLSTTPPAIPAAAPPTAPSASISPADSTAALITSFTANELLNPSGTFTVHQSVTIQPGANPPATVTQSIPVSVTDDQGNQLTSTFRVIATDNTSDPSRTVTVTRNGALATVTYPLYQKTAPLQFTFAYSLTPVVLAGPTADVFKVSATGLNWSLPMQAANITLNTPGNKPQDLTCYTGTSGSTTSNCRIVPTSPVSNHITTDAVLAPGDSLTLFAGFPRHSFVAYYNSWHVGLLAPWVAGALIVIIGLVALLIYTRRRHTRRSHNGSSADS